MAIEIEELVMNAVKEELPKAIKKSFEDGYNSPLKRVIEKAIATREEELHKIVAEAVDKALKEVEFSQYLSEAFRVSLVKQMGEKFMAFLRNG